MVKQVNTRSIQLRWGSMRFDAWNTFVPRVEHPYIFGKSEKSLDKGEPTFHAIAAANQCKAVLALAQQTTLENCTKSTQ